MDSMLKVDGDSPSTLIYLSNMNSDDVDTIPPDISKVEYRDLKKLSKYLISIKKTLRRQMDDIDTELIGIKEELRKREDKGLEGQIYPKDYTKD